MAGTTRGGIHDGRGDGRVRQMGDDGAASTAHSVGRSLALHHVSAARDGATLLKLGLADFALTEEAQKLSNGGLGFIAGRFNHRRQLVETTGNAAGGQDADSDALTNK